MLLSQLQPEGAASPSQQDGEGRAIVGQYATHAEAFERALVALAIGCAVWVEPADGRWGVMAEPHDAARVMEELGYFEREQQRRPPRVAIDADAPPLTGMFLSPLVWAAMILGVFWWQSTRPGLIGLGALDAQALFGSGEAWRLVTALFLHADGAHLISNGLSGIFVFSAVLSAWGSLRGWTLLGVSAVLGNLAAALAHATTTYRSIGASTAVFAALGLLAAHAMFNQRAGRRASWRVLSRPLVSALVVLGMFGAGGQQIDVIAHTTGFLAGLLLGAVVRARA